MSNPKGGCSARNVGHNCSWSIITRKIPSRACLYFVSKYMYIDSIPVEGIAAMTVNGWPLLAELDGTGEFCAMDDDP